jgi:hypothetical protein
MASCSGHVASGAEARHQQTLSVTPEQLFALAEHARNAGDFAAAEVAYRAIASNPDIELRTEARFRLGMMLANREHKYREAAVEFRRILDEKPHAVRVRLELARMDALLNRLNASLISATDTAPSSPIPATADLCTPTSQPRRTSTTAKATRASR